MARFVIATWGDKSRLRVINKETLAAYFDFVDNETGLEYQDWTLIKGKNGFFVSAPGKKSYVDGKGKTQFPKYVAPAFDRDTESKRNAKGDAFLKAVAEIAIAEYERISGDSSSDSDDAPRPKAATRKSGAGPLKVATNVPDFPSAGSDDDDLPF